MDCLCELINKFLSDSQLRESVPPLLQQYDIRSSLGRTPNIRKNTSLIEPCLTARDAAIEAARRRPRLEVCPSMNRILLYRWHVYLPPPSYAKV